MRSAVFISVRDKATRLPGKIYLDLGGRPAIERLIERVKRAKEADLVILCTSVHPDDRKLLATAAACGIEGFAGSEDDKLDRYLRAAERYEFDFVAIVDGDDLFCEPTYIDRIISEHRDSGGDYIIVDGLPLGATAFGIATAAVRRVCDLKDESDTEVWGGYFTRPGMFDVRRLEPDDADRRPDLRMTLDYPEDYEFFKTVYTALAATDPSPSLRAIIRYCDEHPEVVALNRHAQERYEKNLKRAAPIRLRTGS
jgi:spore coat polysaccharide biosynthesis protein SpsF